LIQNGPDGIKVLDATMFNKLLSELVMIECGTSTM